MSKRTYINVDLIPSKVNWRERKNNDKKITRITLDEKINRIERLARKMGIKIGG